MIDFANLPAAPAPKAQARIFRQIHGQNLVYNTCWEDPRIDRRLLQLGGDSRVVMITSAGCNALDYLLDSPAEVHAVDVNPRQNALLELKLAMIRCADYEDFFEMFARGCHRRHGDVYAGVRNRLGDYAAAFWDRKIDYFASGGLRGSFYYRGTAGLAAWLLRGMLLAVRRAIRPHLEDLLAATTLGEQARAFDRMEPLLWGRSLDWLIRQKALMALMGVPAPQIRLIEAGTPGGLSGFVRRKFRHVMTRVPFADNYFWRVYMTGRYSADCCPNYLRSENFDFLRRRVGAVRLHHCTLSRFLHDHPGPYTHFVLLDHQDRVGTYGSLHLGEVL